MFLAEDRNFQLSQRLPSLRIYQLALHNVGTYQPRPGYAATKLAEITLNHTFRRFHEWFDREFFATQVTRQKLYLTRMAMRRPKMLRQWRRLKRDFNADGGYPCLIDTHRDNWAAVELVYTRQLRKKTVWDFEQGILAAGRVADETSFLDRVIKWPST